MPKIKATDVPLEKPHATTFTLVILEGDDVSEAGKICGIYLRNEFRVGFLNLREENDCRVDDLGDASVSKNSGMAGNISYAVIVVGLGLEMTRFNDNVQTKKNAQQ
jgi:hypothetical protein